MTNVLIADDDQNLRKVLVMELSAEGFQVEGVPGGREALQRLQKHDYDVLLLDLNMPGMGGMELLGRIRDQEFPVETVILTANATVTTAVEAMKLGAYDFLTKPIRIEELAVTISKAAEKKNLLHEVQLLRSRVHRETDFPGLVTQDPAMLSLLENVRKAARSSVPIHVFGESGAGKELIARGLHAASDRSDKPFIAVNCSAFTETMFESEFFGHEKGSFTGAAVKKLGLLEMADHGSFFIDEVGEIPMAMQPKLLRVLETGVFYRVGGTREIRVDVRFVSASNRDLSKEINSGGFRKDLFFRITAVTFLVPPLRDRKKDIPLLIEHFLKSNPEFHHKRISPEARQLLVEYTWPGNVRELLNVLVRAALLSRGEVLQPSDFPGIMVQSDLPAGCSLAEMEKTHIVQILRDTNWHRNRAAEILKIDPKTLYRKMIQYGISDKT